MTRVGREGSVSVRMRVCVGGGGGGGVHGFYWYACLLVCLSY